MSSLTAATSSSSSSSSVHSSAVGISKAQSHLREFLLSGIKWIFFFQNDPSSPEAATSTTIPVPVFSNNMLTFSDNISIANYNNEQNKYTSVQISMYDPDVHGSAFGYITRKTKHADLMDDGDNNSDSDKAMVYKYYSDDRRSHSMVVEVRGHRWMVECFGNKEKKTPPPFSKACSMPNLKKLLDQSSSSSSSKTRVQKKRKKEVAVDSSSSSSSSEDDEEVSSKVNKKNREETHSNLKKSESDSESDSDDGEDDLIQDEKACLPLLSLPVSGDCTFAKYSSMDIQRIKEISQFGVSLLKSQNLIQQGWSIKWRMTYNGVVRYSWHKKQLQFSRPWANGAPDSEVNFYLKKYIATVAVGVPSYNARDDKWKSTILSMGGSLIEIKGYTRAKQPWIGYCLNGCMKERRYCKRNLLRCRHCKGQVQYKKNPLL